jgi:hypothetical protein
VPALIKMRVRNIQILSDAGRVCFPTELEGFAEFENESHDA